MDYLLVAVAFICGFLAKQVNLPPLVGYLAAGFGLHILGVTPDSSLETLSDLGVTLLLFTIGLKLDLKNLLKVEVWGVASAHMLSIVALTTLNSLILGYLGTIYFVDLSLTGALLIGFATSFSSTVCAIKVLEERGELRARHGQVAIGILIIQDIAAVIFLTLATSKSPSLWAFGLLALPLITPFIIKILKYCGHGELLPLAGFFLAFSGGELFELVGLKAQLGALVIAIMISGKPKTNELAKSLLNFKDLFLIGFFLSIGFTALPTVDMIFVAMIMAFALPVKTALFFFGMTGARMRSRSSFLASASLANYSEFGLIVCSASVAYGLLPSEWLVIMALGIALSFVFSSILNAYIHPLHGKWRNALKKFERPDRFKDDQVNIHKGASILVIGMGRVGTGAYRTLQHEYPNKVCGIDIVEDRFNEHQKEGHNIIKADAQDPELWEKIDLKNVEMIMFALPNHLDILEILNQLKLVDFKGKLAGIAKYEDNKEKLLEAGIDVVFNFYLEAGAGFADEALQILGKKKSDYV